MHIIYKIVNDCACVCARVRGSVCMCARVHVYEKDCMREGDTSNEYASASLHIRVCVCVYLRAFVCMMVHLHSCVCARVQASIFVSGRVCECFCVSV